MTRFAELSSEAKKELWAVLALRHAKGIGARLGKQLLEHFGSAYEAVQACLASPDNWKSSRQVSAQAAQAFARSQWRGKAEKEWKSLQEQSCAFLLWNDDRYPDILRQLVDAPLLLYYKGDLSVLHGPAVAVVGSRSCTRDGVRFSAQLARDLSRAGVTVVSGLARGIDRAAHSAGMQGPGRSIAVLGTGINTIYPSSNADVYTLLSEQGLLLTEFSPETPALAVNFPIRNRLISGLSQGVVVVEAVGRSGSLITARLALEQNRQVFATPGHMTAPAYEGCRELIRSGARAIFHADEILADLAPLLTHEARKALDKRRKQKREDRDKTPEQLYEESLCAMDEPPEEAPPDTTEKPRSSSRKKTAAAPLPVRPSPGKATINAPSPAGHPALSPRETLVLESLSSAQQHIDALARTLALDVAVLSGTLAILEVRGLVRRGPGMVYSLVARNA